MPRKVFKYRGVRVEVWEKSFRLEGMHDSVFLGRTPDIEQIKRLIDAGQEGIRRAIRAALEIK